MRPRRRAQPARDNAGQPGGAPVVDTFWWLVDAMLHVDTTLDWVLKEYGVWTYAILATIIFVETGVVIAPFLPGDSLLFAAGVFAARGSLNPHILFLLLTAAAILGDNTNYWIGRFLGPRVLTSETSRLFNKNHLKRTNEYFSKYGAGTIMIARFVPLLRCLAPFVAGVGAMPYGQFVRWSVFGGVLWVGICVYAGYLLGNIPAVRDNFEIAVLVIISFTAFLPVIEWLRHRADRPKPAEPANDESRPS
jgi:membrane-associated protein